MEANGKSKNDQPSADPTIRELLEQAQKTKEELEVLKKQIADLRKAIRRLSD